MKKIVLLSDGTGNGAAKRHRTNVWRLYRALDLHRDDQIAFYDDGVGSQEFLPLKILGGALGWGLRRNVLQLYKFLCRNYRHHDDPELADKIYLFGFSRGAFTVRVLAGMIAYCGLCANDLDEDSLDKAAKHNYGAFRSRFKRGFLNWVFRKLVRASDKPKASVHPKIEFIGVWDTVDAYGLPIDELAIAWDWLIFPIRFPDRELSVKVRKACHAISIDDERHTFHPVLWDENNEAKLVQEGKVAPNRIEQVWFTGVHSDVGGGYPMNDLALVPLDWMIAKAEAPSAGAAALHFIPQAREEILNHSDWHGMQHDSRSGLAAYYRYKPRNIASLCADAATDVRIATPKIHRGVFERIKGNSVPYAPIGLPERYEVVSTRGAAKSYEQGGEAEARVTAANHAWRVVRWRRWLYAALLLTTAALAGSRFYLSWKPGGACDGATCPVVDPLLTLGAEALPGFAVGWAEALRQNPDYLWMFLGLFLAMFVLKRVAWNATQSRAMAAWATLKGKG